MLEALLEQLSDAGLSSGHIRWTAPMAGVRVCDFDCAPPERFPARPTHPHLETLYCCRGGLLLSLAGGRQVRLKPREILLLSDPAQVRSVQFADSRFAGILISFVCCEARHSLQGLCALFGGLTLDTRQVGALMAAHHGCAAVRGSAWGNAVFFALRDLPASDRGQYCTLKAVELLYLLCRQSPLVSPVAASYYDQYLTDAVQQVHAYMLEHLAEHLTIRCLAQQFHISPTSLKSCFRQLYGQPLHQYLQQQRLQRAAELLTSSPLSVMQVSVAVGYGSVSQFGVAFRRLYHLPPSRYRRIAAEKNV
ncbi:helix-turn-helix transcriptional regulator [Agathobaculum sp. NSJ-28]|uniref:Helix-turn-helix transcriptional regulator n=2 Tax=Agathobaculum TaxID=2048137 RepID=A0A923RW04_9FIRM|nr:MULTISPECIES: AraC family transcriptional regulator [Agathobaculum]MBC5725459.1 helix-turn-helix transcriptional regulator [Agathobaculum faecis]MBS6882263.1 helix-turn-helix transcriptional regulator [Clostridiaceae bacterium]MCU6789212.1 AraC family transcriptional regulator [Agathobaculum ammoniilyticum]SCJ11410.1 Regulatory protein soxS [uncultured Butyricicoccus sp.]